MLLSHLARGLVHLERTELEALLLKAADDLAYSSAYTAGQSMRIPVRMALQSSRDEAAGIRVSRMMRAGHPEHRWPLH